MSVQRPPSWYLFTILRNRWFLLKALLVVMVPTVVISYLLPRQYTVRTVIMPPETPVEPALSFGGLAISEFLGYFSGGMGFTLPLMSTLSDVYAEILNSRTLADRVILATAWLDSMDLRDRYERDNELGMYWARRMFDDHYRAAVTPTGFIEVEVTTGDPWYSVRVSERVVEVLDSLNTWISSSRATLARELAQTRLAAAESLLAASGDSLMAFEIEMGVIAPDEQLTELITTLADLKRQYLEYRAAAQAISAGYGAGGTVASLEMERRAAAILAIVRDLENGELPAGADSLFPVLSIEDFPSIQFEYARLRSNYEMALQLSGALRLSLQQSLVEEGRRESTVRLLDPPGHPGWKSRPKKLLIWVEVFGVAVALLLSFVFIRENIHESRRIDPAGWEKWDTLLSEIRREFSFLSRGRQPPGSSSSSSR